MNATHLHLLLNHFPVIGTLIGSGLLLWGIVKKQDNVKSIAAALLALMAIIAIPVYLTGEPAEESVEKLPAVSEAMIELHEDAASIAIWLMGITGIASLAALLFAWQKRKTAGVVFVAAAVLSVVCFAAMARTGYYGGQIRHSEIRDTATGVQQNENGTEKGEGNKEKGKDDDD
ncbi:hypothetical protein [Ferruginibacter sp.]|nr:hypothetical protein [Ferruginibacter sp.]